MIAACLNNKQLCVFKSNLLLRHRPRETLHKSMFSIRICKHCVHTTSYNVQTWRAGSPGSSYSIRICTDASGTWDVVVCHVIQPCPRGFTVGFFFFFPLPRRPGAPGWVSCGAIHAAAFISAFGTRFPRTVRGPLLALLPKRAWYALLYLKTTAHSIRQRQDSEPGKVS